MTTDPQAQPHVPIAIIIPCRNEEAHIARCLDSVLANDYPHALLDVVVIDGMSDDRTRAIVADYSQRHGCVRLIDNPNRIKPTALNLGIANTSAEVVIRIDAHALYERDYIPRLVQGLFLHECDNIGGIRETDPGSSTWSRAVAVVIGHPFAAGNALYRTGVAHVEPREVDTVFCGCYRRDVFERIGIFNEKLIRTQDREFNERLRTQGGKIVLDPTVRCTYFPRTHFWDYCRWTCQGAYWLYLASRFTRTQMTSWRNWVPGLFVLWHLLVMVVSFIAPVFGVIAAVPIGLYWVVNPFVSIQIAAREARPLMAPCLLLLFAVTHYGYGAGSIAGWLSARWNQRQIVNCSPERISEFRRTAA